MTKVTRIPLICAATDKDGKEIDYKEIFHLLWDLQRETRMLKNKAIQLCWEWYNFSSDYKKEHGDYPDNETILGYKGGIRSYLYDKLKGESVMYSTNISCALDSARNQFQASLKEYLRGDRSIIEYKSNQPIELYNKAILLDYHDNEYWIGLKLLSRKGEKEKGFPSCLLFKGVVNDKSTRDILNRCMDGLYKISGSKLIYDKKKKWCLNLSYSFEPEMRSLDKDKILGVNVGIYKPFMASVYGDKARLFAEGGRDSEIEVFRRKIEGRRRSLLKQGKMCGDGRIGHGYKTRTAPANALEDKIARFRDTMNHKYSRAVVDYAIKNNCGIIQMEDLTGITEGEKPRYLKNWSYYDLQMKIESKAKENGIKFVKIAPQYTSQRCSKCGYIHADNRPDQPTFECLKCGYKENADYNASQNIAIKDIDKIIEASDIPKKKKKSDVA